MKIQSGLRAVELEEVLRMLGEISRLTSCKGINCNGSPEKVAIRLIDKLEEIETYCERVERELTGTDGN